MCSLVLYLVCVCCVTSICFRQCATNQYLRKKDDPHRYCQGPCAEITKCGPVIVPEHHLQVGHIVNVHYHYSMQTQYFIPTINSVKIV